MDNTPRYREIIKNILMKYARFSPSHGNIRIDPIFDEKNDRYVLMQTGWDRERRIRGNLVYIVLDDGKVFIEYDGLGHGITEDLIKSGIAEDKIILSYMPELKTA